MEPFELTAALERGDVVRAMRAFPRLNHRRWLELAGFTAVWVVLLLVLGPGGFAAVVCGLLFAVTTARSPGAPWILARRRPRAIGYGQPMTWAYGPDGQVRIVARGTPTPASSSPTWSWARRSRRSHPAGTRVRGPFPPDLAAG